MSRRAKCFFWQQVVLPRSAADEFIFLGCDGIFDAMSNASVCEFIKANLALSVTLGSICESLIDECFKKGSTDNMTAMLIAFEGADKYSSNDMTPRRMSMALSARFVV